MQVDLRPAVEVWAVTAGRAVSGRAARLVVGALADRAHRDGRVDAAAADLAACTCLPVAEVADVLGVLAGCGLLARDGAALLLAPVDGDAP